MSRLVAVFKSLIVGGNKSAVIIVPSVGDVLLLETGDSLLLETGDSLLLE